jgi:tRNA dimethylallyltransferase
VRAQLEADLASEGVAELARRLRALAPGLARRTDLQNPRRVVRALEIATLRGDAPLPTPLGYPAPVAGLQLALEPVEHRRRIYARARAQFDAGLVDEARALRERFDPSLPAFSAIGYRESWAHLDGQLTLEAAIELDALHNAQFARRQRTWFRSERSLAVIDAQADPLPSALTALEGLLAAAGAQDPDAVAALGRHHGAAGA